MTKRITAAFGAVAMLLLAGCGKAPEPAQPATQEPPAAPAPPAPASQPPVSTAPTGQETMAKPAGTDPAKLAEHAKALRELGYQAEAAKLYGHACNWGYAPACAQLNVAAAKPMARMTEPGVARPATVTAVAAAPAPVAQPAPAAKPAPTAPAAASVTAPTAPAPAPVTQASAIQAPAPAPAPVAVALAKPAADKPAAAAATDPHKLSAQAQGLERIGYVPVAVKLYRDACIAGDGLACKRLGEIYIKGSDEVARDYAESVRWYERARLLGVAVPTLEKRTVYR